MGCLIVCFQLKFDLVLIIPQKGGYIDLIIRTMDPGSNYNPYPGEKIRSKLVSFFLENIGIGFEGDLTAEINRLGVQIIEDPEVVPDDSWNKIKNNL